MNIYRKPISKLAMRPVYYRLRLNQLLLQEPLQLDTCSGLANILNAAALDVLFLLFDL